MAVKPTDLPRWGDNGGDIVEPPEGKKDVGWAVAEKPPAQFSNWLLNLIYQWCVYLDEFLSTANTWTALQTFDAGVAVDDLQADTLTTAEADVRHAERLIAIPACAAWEVAPDGASDFDGQSWKVNYGTTYIFFPISVPVGSHLTNLAVFAAAAGASTAQPTISLRYRDLTTGAETSPSGNQQIQLDGTNIVSENQTLDHTVAANRQYYAVFDPTTSDEIVYAVVVSYDRTA